MSSAFIGVWPSSMVARGIVHSFVSLFYFPNQPCPCWSSFGNLEPLCSGIAWEVILVSSAFIGVWPSSMVARGIVHSFVSLFYFPNQPCPCWSSLGNLEPLCSGIAWEVILVSSAFIGVWPSSMVARGIVHSFVSLVFSKPTMSLLEFLWEPRAVVLWHRVEGDPRV